MPGHRYSFSEPFDINSFVIDIDRPVCQKSIIVYPDHTLESVENNSQIALCIWDIGHVILFAPFRVG
jgi:hypothetical protein